MKSSADFTEDNTISLLLVGEPGTGKTNVAMAFDAPYFISTDRKLGNAVRRFPGKKFYYDYADSDAKGNLLDIKDRWKRVNTLITEAGTNPDVKTIVLDNLTDVGFWLEAYIASGPAMSKGGRPKVGEVTVLEQSDWQAYQVLMVNMITNLKTRGKTCIVCCHEAVDKDEVNGTLRYFPRIRGALQSTLPSMFSNYWQCSTQTVGPDKVRYFVRTKPTPRMVLINSMGLPAEFEFTWEDFKKYMEDRK